MSEPTTPNPDDFPYEVTIAWGSEEVRDENPDAFSVYRFATRAELDAFQMGADEGAGWLDYENVCTRTPEEGLVRGAGWPVCEGCGEDLPDLESRGFCSDHCGNQVCGDPCPPDCEQCEANRANHQDRPEEEERHGPNADD